MKIKPIRNDDDLRAAFQRLEQVFQAQAGTPEEDEMEILVTLIEAYEHKHFPIGPADPVDAIRFRLEQQGLGALHRIKRASLRSFESQASAKFADD
jgi:HTH-type transcriptional regulator/antitoxin HigA